MVKRNSKSTASHLAALRFRYPRHSLRAISHLTGLPVSTVQYKLATYLKRGTIDDRRRYNSRPCTPMPPEVQQFLLSEETLFETQGLGLKKRCQMVRARFSFVMSVTRLRTLYRKAGIRYGKPESILDRALELKQQLQVERFEFAQEFLSLDKRRIIYVNETSFNPTYRITRVWQYRDSRIEI